MNKQDFLASLRQGLKNLPQNEADKFLDYYAEMIDDRIEEGVTETEAITALGPVENLIAQIREEIISTTPFGRLIKEKLTPSRRLRVWEIVLLVLGSPIWLSLLLTVFALVLTVYAVLWALVLTVYAVDLALAAGGVAGIFSLFLIPSKGFAPCAATCGLGLFGAGLAILLFYPSNFLAKGMIKVSKRIFLFIKARFVKKEVK